MRKFILFVDEKVHETGKVDGGEGHFDPRVTKRRLLFRKGFAQRLGETPCRLAGPLLFGTELWFSLFRDMAFLSMGLIWAILADMGMIWRGEFSLNT